MKIRSFSVIAVFAASICSPAFAECPGSGCPAAHIDFFTEVVNCASSNGINVDQQAAIMIFAALEENSSIPRHELANYLNTQDEAESGTFNCLANSFEVLPQSSSTEASVSITPLRQSEIRDLTATSIDVDPFLDANGNGEFRLPFRVTRRCTLSFEKRSDVFARFRVTTSNGAQLLSGGLKSGYARYRFFNGAVDIAVGNYVLIINMEQDAGFVGLTMNVNCP